MLKKIFFRLFLYLIRDTEAEPPFLLFCSIVFSHYVLFFATGVSDRSVAFLLIQIYMLFI